MGRRRDSTSTTAGSTAFNSAFEWVYKQSIKVQVALALSISIVSIVVLHYFLDESDYFYLFSEVTHSIGNIILLYKLIKYKNCSGISLRSQEVTAVFLLVRLICSASDEIDFELHLVLDSISLIATGWVMYLMRFKLQSSYDKELDNMPIHYLVRFLMSVKALRLCFNGLVPCFVLSLFINPGDSEMTWTIRLLMTFWAFATYVEAVSVLPQLRYIQNSKVVEPFTAHYVFALGVSRFFGFGHWALMIYETGGKNLLTLGADWLIWLITHLTAETVQTFILADFCYYYIKSVVRGQKMSLPMPV